MGREIRLVPPNWEHPSDDRGNPIRIHDTTFEEAAAEWKAGFVAWEAGTHWDFEHANRNEPCEFWEWDGDPPSREHYRPAFTEEPTWYQMYETVSEGTPVTPPFATKEELIDYLCTYGDYGYQHHEFGSIPSRKAATAFVEAGSAVTMVSYDSDGVVHVMTGMESL